MKRIPAFVLALLLVFCALADGDRACPGCGCESGTENACCGSCGGGRPEEGPVPAAAPNGSAAAEAMGGARAGDIVVFGRYPRTAPGTDASPMEWTVLERDGDELVLLSRCAPDCMPYDIKGATAAWETSTVRAWLNGDFYEKAFTDEERGAIVPVELENRDNAVYGTPGGRDTVDRVYLLSLDEVEKYFPLIPMPDRGWCFGISHALLTAPTDYAKTMGAKAGRMTRESLAAIEEDTGILYPESVLGMDTCWWWLRSPGSGSGTAAFINIYGYVFGSGRPVSDSIPVRPVVRVRVAPGKASGDVWYCKNGHACPDEVCGICGERWTDACGWICAECGHENTTLFCEYCGQRRPLYAFTYTCGNCGQESLLSDAYCENCGAMNPNAPGWRCADCGAANSTEDSFCTECGKARPDR